MASGIVQGSTPRLTFKPIGNFKVSDLGTPVVYIRQGLIEESFNATVSKDSAYLDLTSEFTARLDDRSSCDVQIEWTKEAVTNSNGNVTTPKKVIRFPIHKVPVIESIFPASDSEES